jgi:hypothetical protein
MNPVYVIIENRTKIVTRGDKEKGDFKKIEFPYNVKPLYEDKEDYDDGEYIKTIVFDTKNKVYKMYMHDEVMYYANKEKSFSDNEIDFLNGYKKRFIYCISENEEYILDNKNDKIFRLDNELNSKEEFEEYCDKIE